MISWVPNSHNIERELGNSMYLKALEHRGWDGDGNPSIWDDLKASQASCANISILW